MNLTGQTVRPKKGRPEERKKDKTARAKGQRQPRVIDKAYKGVIATLPSILSGGGPCEVVHVRYGSPAHDKRPTGMQEKPSDMWCLPLTSAEHREGKNAQHSTNERMWWAAQCIDPLQACKDLHAVYTDPDYDETQRHTRMVTVIAAHRALGQIRRETQEETNGPAT
ncbi:hypothetical protein QMT40_001824 [Parvibaculaceae bacterium PLY_AMNH_Bact1]|nr:hypothetical protein QMT40_001824 [Parvibaculaceae bacterium PLY_AMNH_Bact1]